MRRKQFLVIGLGRFGTAVATTLFELGHEVVAVDESEERVRDLMDRVTHAAIVDAADERALRSLGVESFDAVIIAIGANVEANIFATLAAKDAGARHVVCKAHDDVARRILEKLGAERVVRPEHDSGVELARSLASPGLIAELELTREVGVIELAAGAELTGTLATLDLTRRFGVHVVAHARGDTVRVALGPEAEVRRGDKLVLVGKKTVLETLRRDLGG